MFFLCMLSNGVGEPRKRGSPSRPFEPCGGLLSASTQPNGLHDLRVLFRRAGLELLDFRCHARHAGHGGEEVATKDELVFVRSGAFELEMRGERWWADPTRVVLLRRGEPYRVAHPTGGGDACTVLALDRMSLGPELAEDAELHGDFRRAPPCVAPLSGPAYALQARLLSAAQRRDVDALALEEALVELAHHASAALVRRPPRRRIPVRSDTRLRHGQIVGEAQRLLARRAFEPLRLADIAEALRWSPFHLARLFREAAGVSLHRYRNRLRLRHALDRVACGERDLTMLALESGFSSHSHLDAAFRLEFGFPPSALRRPPDLRHLRQLSKIPKV